MTRKEYKETLDYELFRYFSGKKSILQRLRITYFQPNTNCIYLARKMWYLNSRGRIAKIRAKLLYLKIIRKYGCIIYPNAQVGKGFHITHPTGIVIGNCKIGTDFMIYQNCTVGNKKPGDSTPEIGNHVELCTNSLILGHVRIEDDVLIGANSLVIKDITESGVYVGNPIKKIR